MGLLGFIPTIILVLVVIGVIAVVSRRSRGTVSPTGGAEGGQVMQGDAVRFLIYAVCFVGLMAVLFAVYGLVGLVLAETVFRASNLLSASDARQQASYYLAALIVATPLWLGFWRVAQQRVARAPEERNAPERRLYFALVFAIASVVCLYALHMLLRVVLTLPGPHDTNTALKDGVGALIRLLVYGGVLVGYTRLAMRERPSDQRDPARDFAVYVLTGFSLVFLAVGAINGLAAIISQLQGAQHTILLGSTPGSVEVTWGEIAACIISGGVVWAAITRYDQSYPGVRAFRIAYLYVVLTASILVTLIFGTDLLYELVRRIFGYHTGDNWGFLHDVLPPLVVGAAIWAYHWSVLRHQAALAGVQTRPGAIPWPRRWLLAGLSFVGLAMAASGAVTLLWFVFDFLFKTHDLTNGAWWRDQTSMGIASLLVGLAVWLSAWSIQERAALADPQERSAEARRWLLGGNTLIATLVAVGFTIALLWLVLRMLLGGPHDATTVSNIVKYLSAAAVAAGIAAYHGAILLSDVRAAGPRSGRLQVGALLAPGGERVLSDMSKNLGRRIEVLGYLTASEIESSTPISVLTEQVRALDASGAERVLLVVGPDGGTAYPYSRRQSRPLAAAPREDDGRAPSADTEPVAS